MMKLPMPGRPALPHPSGPTLGVAVPMAPMPHPMKKPHGFIKSPALSLRDALVAKLGGGLGGIK